MPQKFSDPGLKILKSSPFAKSPFGAASKKKNEEKKSVMAAGGSGIETTKNPETGVPSSIVSDFSKVGTVCSFKE